MTKLSDLTDFEINGMVAELTQKVGDHTQTTNKTFIHEYADVGGLKNLCVGWKEFDPCNNWSDAGSIIVEHRINIEWHEWKNGIFRPYALNNETMKSCYDPNPLRAAMIVFLEMQ